MDIVFYIVNGQILCLKCAITISETNAVFGGGQIQTRVASSESDQLPTQFCQCCSSLL